MAGQAFHFLSYSAEDLTYAKKRYTDEVNRLFGVMDARLKTRKFLAGAYSIADIACWGWVIAAMNFQPLDEFPALKAWQERMAARPGGQARPCPGRGIAQAPHRGTEENPFRSKGAVASALGFSVGLPNAA